MPLEKYLQPYTSLIQGVVALFTPFAEVSVHDLTTGTISALYGNITKREIGDASPLAALQIPATEFPDVFEPYYETNYDGRKIKCTTITLRDEDSQPVALICLNLDVSVFHNMQLNLQTFLQVNPHAGNPVELFAGNWQEKIDTLIAQYLSQRQLVLQSLTREQKRELIEELSKHGVFFIKKAPSYIANQLGISRATVYNYLKVLRAEE